MKTLVLFTRFRTEHSYALVVPLSVSELSAPRATPVSICRGYVSSCFCRFLFSSKADHVGIVGLASCWYLPWCAFAAVAFELVSASLGQAEHSGIRATYST